MSALFVSAGGYHHHLGLNIWAGVNAPVNPSNATGIDYFTIVYAEPEEVEQAVERLRQAGVEVTRDAEARYAVDPQNIRIRLVSAA
jgi:catechol 2,3-dioxygenase